MSAGKQEKEENGSPWVLIVEDDAVSRLLLLRIIARTKCRVHEASTVKAGLEFVRRQRYRLIFVDCHLPDGHGEEVVQFVRSRADRVCPAVGISSDDSAGNIKRIMQAGAERFLCKPISNAEVAALLKQYCSGDG